MIPGSHACDGLAPGGLWGGTRWMAGGGPVPAAQLGDRQLLTGGGEEIDVTFDLWNQQKYSEADYSGGSDSATHRLR